MVKTGGRLGTKAPRHRFGVAVATVDGRRPVDPGLVGRARYQRSVFIAGPAERLRSGPLIMGFEWAEARVADYHEVRGALEPIIYHHAARHRTEADIRALRAILASMSAHLDDPRAYARYSAAFHRRIARLTPNLPLRSMYVTLLDFFEDEAADGGLPGAVHPGDVDVHRQLVDAIEQGEMPELEGAIRRHDRHRLSLGALVPAAGVSRRLSPEPEIQPAPELRPG